MIEFHYPIKFIVQCSKVIDRYLEKLIIYVAIANGNDDIDVKQSVSLCLL